MKEGPIKKEQVQKILKDAITLMSKYIYSLHININIIIFIAKEPNTVKVGEPIVIVGDLHG